MLFRSEGRPTVVAGVPPDYFSATGQLWGNPLYRWDGIAQSGYDWWIERFRAALADSWARQASTLGEASEALALMREAPAETREGWSPFVCRLVEATPHGVSSDARMIAEGGCSSTKSD